MIILQSPDFLREVKKTNKPKYSNVYGSIIDELNIFFSENLNFEEVWAKNYFIFQKDQIRINKVRLPNHKQKSGKSGGFRAIILCDKNDESVILLYVYPKTGSEGKNSLDSEFEKKLVRNASKYKADGLLTVFFGK